MPLLWRKKPRRVRRNGRSRGIGWQFVYGTLAIIVVSAAGYGVWYATRLPALTISSVEVSGGDTVSHEEVRQVVTAELEGAYVLIVPKRFTLFYPAAAIAARVAKIPRIEHVAVETTDKNTLRVSFSEYTPHALWCAESDNENCVFLAKSGYAFAKAPPLRGGVYLRHTFESKEPEVGVEPLSSADMERIDAFTDAVREELDFQTASVEHTAAGDEKYRLAGGGTLLVSPKLSAQATFDNLRSILDSDEFAHIAPGNFNYIDLRFGNRVFVNEELSAVAQEEATTTEDELSPDE